MNPRLILYISGLLIYGVFRSFYPTPMFDEIEIQSDEVFLFNGKSYPAKEIDNVIRDFRKSIPPDKKSVTVIEFSRNENIKMGIYYDVKNALRKNGFLLILLRDRPFWQFWNRTQPLRGARVST